MDEKYSFTKSEKDGVEIIRVYQRTTWELWGKKQDSDLFLDISVILAPLALSFALFSLKCTSPYLAFISAILSIISFIVVPLTYSKSKRLDREFSDGIEAKNKNSFNFENIYGLTDKQILNLVSNNVTVSSLRTLAKNQKNLSEREVVQTLEKMLEYSKREERLMNPGRMLLADSQRETAREEILAINSMYDSLIESQGTLMQSSLGEEK